MFDKSLKRVTAVFTASFQFRAMPLARKCAAIERNPASTRLASLLGRIPELAPAKLGGTEW